MRSAYLLKRYKENMPVTFQSDLRLVNNYKHLRFGDAASTCCAETSMLIQGVCVWELMATVPAPYLCSAVRMHALVPTQVAELRKQITRLQWVDHQTQAFTGKLTCLAHKTWQAVINLGACLPDLGQQFEAFLQTHQLSHHLFVNCWHKFKWRWKDLIRIRK